MNKEKIKKFDKEQLELLLNDLQDIDKFTGFKDGAFKYELGKYQASLLINYIQKQKEIIDKVIKYITSYESISIIQGLTHAEDNKQLDEKTMVEMTNRYLLVHNKLLRILEDEEVSE